MKSLMNLPKLAVAIAITANVVVSVRAAETAVQFDDSSFRFGGGGQGVFGWQFSTQSEISVSALGLYDYFGGDGLVDQHAVGIWDISHPSNPLVQSVIPSGTAAPLVNNFRYVNISPVILPVGREYVIGALYIYEDARVGEVNHPLFALTVGPGLEFGGRRWGGLSSSVLTFPENYTRDQQESFGPNFTYTIIPEPSMLALCMLGGTILFAGTHFCLQRTRPSRSGCNGFARIHSLSLRAFRLFPRG